MGHSVGHWEGDSLVVDVTGFNGKNWFDRAENFHSASLHLVERFIPINQRVYRGNWDTPKGRKGKRTAREVALSPGTLAEIEEWKLSLQNQTSGGLLFPTERGTPLSRDNLWRRSLR